MSWLTALRDVRTNWDERITKVLELGREDESGVEGRAD
jgi:hypothetical protein